MGQKLLQSILASLHLPSISLGSISYNLGSKTGLHSPDSICTQSNLIQSQASQCINQSTPPSRLLDWRSVELRDHFALLHETPSNNALWLLSFTAFKPSLYYCVKHHQTEIFGSGTIWDFVEELSSLFVSQPKTE